jgi:hypothetical protein
MTSAPAMMGDLLYGSRSVTFPYSRASGASAALVTGATSIFNPKVAEDESPLPQNRIYFRYNFYNDAQAVVGLGASSTVLPPGASAPLTVFTPTTKLYDYHLYTFGFEKTFWNNMMSFELRVPLQTSLASSLDLRAGSVTSFTPATASTPPVFGVASTPQDTLGNTDTEFGNMTMLLKALLYRDPNWALTFGLSMTAPTGQDEKVSVTDFTGLINIANNNLARFRQFQIDNETWSLSPFLAALWVPNQRWFAQGFLEFDAPLNKSTVTYTEVTTSPGFEASPLTLGILDQNPTALIPPIAVHDRIREQMLLHVDVGTGFWLMHDRNRDWLTGIAPTVEVHYTGALDKAQIITLPQDPAVTATSSNTFAIQPPPTIGNLRNRVNIVDLTVGTTFEIASSSTVAAGFAFPLTQGDNKTFDWEFQLQLNYYFGAKATH